MEEFQTNRKIFGFELDRVGKFFIVFCITSLLFMIIWFTVIQPTMKSQFYDEIKNLSCPELVELKKEFQFDTSFRFSVVDNEYVLDGCRK